MKPIEAASIFAEPRLRLYHKVPVIETLKFVERFKHQRIFHPRIKYFVSAMTEGVGSFFRKDISQLSIFAWQLEAGEYKVTSRGKIFLGDRLCSIYTDGIEYQIISDILKKTRIEPILELESRILESKNVAYMAEKLSRKLCDETGIEISTLAID